MSKLESQYEDETFAEQQAGPCPALKFPFEHSCFLVKDLGSVCGKMLCGTLIAFAFYVCYTYASLALPRSIPRTTSVTVQSTTFKPVTPPLGYSQQFEQSWSQYSPYFPRNAYQGPPEGCKINQVSTSQ